MISSFLFRTGYTFPDIAISGPIGSDSQLLLNQSDRFVRIDPFTFDASIKKVLHMKKRFLGFVLVGLMTSTQLLKAQDAGSDPSYKKYFVGSTLMVLGNFIPNDPNRPDFAQVNLGYRITPKDAVFIELKTSKFSWPLGVPWGELFDGTEHNFPGYVRQKVVGLAYNRYWWKGIFTGIHAMNAFQTYRDEEGKKLNNGFTLFLTYRVGYQFKFFKNRFFIEPSIGLTHWPVKTNTPPAFKAEEIKWPNYFAYEPGLHFGFNF